MLAKTEDQNDAQTPIVVIGAGITGLTCATYLKESGHDVLVIDKSDRVGGRIKTDFIDGYTLDHGFQVLQTAYPEAQMLLDYDTLNLHAFEPGALIASSDEEQSRLVRMSDPWRRPGQALQTFFNGIGTFSDRFKLANLRLSIASDLDDSAYESMTTDTYLREYLELSPEIIEQFFRPWFSGVFLETQLATSARVFRFVFRMLALGDASLPEKGMAAIPDQLARRIGNKHIKLEQEVVSISQEAITIKSAVGVAEHLPYQKLIVAIDGFSRNQFLAEHGLISTLTSRTPQDIEQEVCATTCLYFAADQSPDPRKLLMLQPDRNSPINNLCIPSNVCANYAPEGKALISVSCVGGYEDSVKSTVRRDLAGFFGKQAYQWRHLKTYHIACALPTQGPGEVTNEEVLEIGPEFGPDIIAIHGDTASINSSMRAGRVAAQTAIQSRLLPEGPLTLNQSA